MSYPRLVVDATGARVPLLGERVAHYVDHAHGTVIARAQPSPGQWVITIRWDESDDDVGEHNPDELLDPADLELSNPEVS